MARVSAFSVTMASGQTLSSNSGEESRVPRYLETIPTAGYRFIANVVESE
jgi:DNA-binding winged helix-turn-helix (wHTH) protein